LRQSRVEIVAFIIVSCFFVPVIGSLSAGALHRLIRSGPLLATYLCLHRGTLTKNVAGRQSRFLKNPSPQKTAVKNYMSSKAGTRRSQTVCRIALGFDYCDQGAGGGCRGIFALSA
jgi:hypothetical protein